MAIGPADQVGVGAVVAQPSPQASAEAASAGTVVTTAHALSATPKTVELQLRKSCRKLGISSRRQRPAELATP